MQKEQKVPPLVLAYGVSAVILVGMSLAWLKGLDFGSMIVGVATIRGWHVSWLPFTVLVAIVCYVVAYRNEEDKKWLWGALLFSILSFIPIIGVGIDIFSGADSLALSSVPLVGFWITLIGFIGLIVHVAKSLLDNMKTDQ